MVTMDKEAMAGRRLMAREAPDKCAGKGATGSLRQGMEVKKAMDEQVMVRESLEVHTGEESLAETPRGIGRDIVGKVTVGLMAAADMVNHDASLSGAGKAGNTVGATAGMIGITEATMRKGAAMKISTRGIIRNTD